MLVAVFPVFASLPRYGFLDTDAEVVRSHSAGNTVRYAYDALDRLVARDAFNHEGHGKHETFAYDAVGNLLAASNEVARLSFSYDVMDRLATATTVVSNATFTAAYARDTGGLVTNLVYAPGKSIARTYDADGRLATVSDWLGHTWHFAWDGAGKPTGGTSPGGIAATNRYDAAGRLESWSVGTLAGRTVTRDAAGRLESWSVGTLAGRTVTRDAAGLKTREDITAGPHPAPAFVRYATNTFDAADRLVSAQVRYGSHTNAAVSETYLYDGNGALTSLVSGSNTIFTATYSPLGQLSSLFVPFVPFVVECTYDPLGNRLISGDRLFIPDHADPLKRPLIEADAATGAPLRYYLWAPGRLLGFIDAASGALTVAHCDEYGSVVALTDEAGNTLHTACYGPNGQDWGATGANPTPFAWLGGHGVQQVAVSEHLGPLYLTRHRLYSASLQRFLSPDPLGLAGGLNLYAYAEGDPLSYIDPLGLCPENNYWETGSYLGDVGQFVAGYGDAIAGTVGGLYNVVRHPIQTAAGLFNAVAHPVQTAQAMADGIAETWDSGNRGRGQIVGNTLIIAATIAAPHAKTSSIAKTANAAKSGQTFEIIDGVRRAKAAQSLGKQSVAANIFNADGQLIGQGNIPIRALTSPNKSVIDMSTQAQFDRYMSIQRGLQEGASLPPISVTPGSRGIPVSDVIFDAIGAAQ
ncbi:MAG: RHS repeat domain-containing protein [Kiritimatiellia bacterium]